MITELLILFVTGVFAIAILKTILFWSYQKILKPKRKRTTTINTYAQNISNYFNSMLKDKKLTRKDVLEIRRNLERFADKNISYKTDAHLIYHTLKHSKLRVNEIGTVEMILDAAKRRNK